MREQLEESLRFIVDALEFRSPQEFIFAGRPSSLWLTPGEDNALVKALQGALYGNCYTRAFRGSLEESGNTLSEDGGGWVDALSAANTSKDRWEEGWTVQQFMPSGQIYAQKREMIRSFWPGEFIKRAHHGMAPQPGTPIAVFFPRESRTLQAGFYFVFGEALADQPDEVLTVRYYWNLKRAGAAPLVRGLSHSLNKYQIPFRFKILIHPGMLGRSDAAILYVGRRYYRAVAELCRETHAKIADELNDGVPLFSLPLAKGLSFAEDPGTQESFGMMRCRLVAEGLWLAFCEGQTSKAERLERIRSHFTANGVSLAFPYLNAGPIHSYEFPQ